MVLPTIIKSKYNRFRRQPLLGLKMRQELDEGDDMEPMRREPRHLGIQVFRRNRPALQQRFGCFGKIGKMVIQEYRDFFKAPNRREAGLAQEESAKNNAPRGFFDLKHAMIISNFDGDASPAPKRCRV